MQRARLGARLGVRLGWLLVCTVVFGLFNTCSSHEETGRTARWLAGGDYPLTLSTAWRALRAAGRNDSDIGRYFAYANAALGRPYDRRFVRPPTPWTAVGTNQAQPSTDLDEADEPARPLRPWREFSVEYPPAFFLLAIPPALLTSDFDRYFLYFELYMGLLLLLALALASHVMKRLWPTEERSLLPWACASILALGVISIRRFDPIVSVAVVGLVCGVVARRPLLAGSMVGLGAAAKLVPLVVVPIAVVVYLARRRHREALLFGAALLATIAACLPPYLWAAGEHALDLFRYHGERPLQIESTWAALLMLGRVLVPDVAHISHAFGGANVVSRIDWVLVPLASALAAAAVAGSIMWTLHSLRHAAKGTTEAQILVAGTCAALAGPMVLSKVFSPQYVTWLFPLGLIAALARPDRARWLYLAALLLTQLEYPYLYDAGLANRLSPVFAIVVLGRNLALALFVVTLLSRPWRQVVTTVESPAALPGTDETPGH